MTTLPVENTLLPQIINDWAHQNCVRSVVNLMTDQLYSPKSVRSTIQTISAFVDWKKDSHNGDPALVRYDDFDRFIACRAATAALRNGERRSMQRLRAKLIEAGVVDQIAPAFRPIDDLVGQFATELRRRGYAPPTISAHLRYSGQFLRDLWIDGPGIAHLQYDDIRDYVGSHFERHTAATAQVIATRLRVFLQFCWSKGVITLDLAQAVPMVKSYRLSALPSFMTADHGDPFWRQPNGTGSSTSPQGAKYNENLREARHRDPSIACPAVVGSKPMSTMLASLEQYLALRRSLGFKLSSQESRLRNFVSYAQAHGEDHITAKLAVAWAEHQCGPRTWSSRLYCQVILPPCSAD